MIEKFVLAAADYAILGTMLAISAGIGIYFRIFGTKQTSNADYLLAGKNMPIFPVVFSMMATSMSATTLVGLPAEMYIYGTNMAFINIGFLLGVIISVFVFLPVYFNTGVSTSYEYLERRFGKSTGAILSGIFLFQTVLFNGISLYAPALALSAVTNLSTWTSVISIGVVCTFYCTLGGMKAVLWTDVFQSVLMYICLIAIIMKGYLDLGGFQNIFKAAYDGGRIVMPTFEMDISRRYTMWSILLQGLIIAIYCYGASQILVQRQLTLKTIRRSQITTIVSSPMLVIFQLLCCLCGLIIYAYFKRCDPMTSATKPINSADQLMPYYISSTMQQYPGLPGLCIAGIFSASLTTVSSGINSMAAVTYEDIIHRLWPNLPHPVLISRIASIFYGSLSIFVAFLAATMDNLIQANVLIAGMVSGPTLGVYILAALTRTTNEMGVNVGVLAGFLFAGFTAYVPNKRYYPQLPVESNCSIPLCNALNFTTPADYSFLNVTALPLEVSLTSKSSDPFPVSYMWITPISLLVCLIVGYFGSWISSCVRGQSEPISSDLLSPILQWFCCKDKKIQSKHKAKEIMKDHEVTRF